METLYVIFSGLAGIVVGISIAHYLIVPVLKHFNILT